MVQEKQRKFTRILFDRRAYLDFFTERYDNCRLSNLSLTGMYVTGVFPRHLGEHCLINLVLRGGTSDVSLQALGKVVRRNNTGIALEFTSMTFESYMYLQVTLLYEAEEPMVIGLELPENCPFKLINKENVFPSHSNFKPGLTESVQV